MKVVALFLCAFAVPATSLSTAPGKQFTDAELETVLAHVLTLPRAAAE